jgi:acetyltransferase-like isoleucine patch superfamily enzyme
MSHTVKLTLSRLLTPWARWMVRMGTARRQFWSFCLLRAQLPDVQPCVVCQGPIELHGTKAVHLGRNLYIYPGQYWETREAGELHIADDVVLSRGVHLVAYARVTLGEGTMVGEYASVRDANHRRDDGDIRHAGHDARPVHIGRRVWIGRGACVLAGVSIGDGAVVAANAVVTHDVAAGAVVAGVPARPIQRRPRQAPARATLAQAELEGVS